MSTVYLNGKYLPADQATVSVNDRGFVLADGVYEVTPVYRGRLFLFDRHAGRLQRGLSELRIDADLSRWEDIHRGLLSRNDLEEAETSLVYMQITRGAAPRTHAFPKDPVPPTVYGFAKAFQRPARERWERGFRAITWPDQRWHRVDIKTIQLLPNALAMQAAAEAGAQNVIFLRDGMVTEGGHANVFAVFDGTLVTHPANNLILHGITRGFVMELARELGVPVEERAFSGEALNDADELFYTGTTTEVYPTVAVDDRPIGDGRVGPVTRRLHAAFMDTVASLAVGEGVT
jgi:D-alanine transaminase